MNVRYDVRMNTFLDRKKPDDNWELIKGALRVRGSSLSEVARTLGVTRNAVHHVKDRSYPAVQSEIARVLGCAPADLWPARYHKDGTPKRQRPNSPMVKPSVRGPRKSSGADSRSNAREAV